MAEQKKLVAEITSMDEDFTQWYTDVVIKAGLIAYSHIKGFMVYKPAGYALWEAVQKHLDARFKAVGVENVYLPMMIPENLLSKESDLVNGFAPEVAWVTHGGQEELQERICVRPTSETLFSDFYKDEVQSYIPRTTTSGAALSAGRRRPDLSFAPESSCGRRDTQSTPLWKRRSREPS